jgi:hypothetical protein
MNPRVEGSLVLTTDKSAVELVVRSQEERDQSLTEEMLARFRESRQRSPWPAVSCIVVVQDKTVRSSLARALFALWKEVQPAGGQVVCVNYPQPYMHTLTTLGITSKLPGFSLKATKDEAMRGLPSNRPAAPGAP